MTGAAAACLGSIQGCWMLGGGLRYLVALLAACSLVCPLPAERTVHGTEGGFQDCCPACQPPALHVLVPEPSSCPVDVFPLQGEPRVRDRGGGAGAQRERGRG